jgi:hypothetical protein
MGSGAVWVNAAKKHLQQHLARLLVASLSVISPFKEYTRRSRCSCVFIILYV